MVSLTTVEAYLCKLWPTEIHAVVNVPDNKKGEALVLLTTNINAKRKEIILYAKSQGIGEISVPKKIILSLSKRE